VRSTRPPKKEKRRRRVPPCLANWSSTICVPKRSGKPSAEAQDLIREHP